MSAEILVTSGTGPEPARWFAGALADVIADRYPVLWRAGGSLGLDLEPEALHRWIGTHELVWKTGPGRKRWFAGVAVFPSQREAPPLDPRDVAVTAARAGGPGGQAVNTTSSAVLARHLPSGLQVRVQDQRSQHANRRVALERLAQALAALARAEGEERDQRRWLTHHRLERGRPVARWRRDPEGRLVEAG